MIKLTVRKQSLHIFKGRILSLVGVILSITVLIWVNYFLFKKIHPVVEIICILIGIIGFVQTFQSRKPGLKFGLQTPARLVDDKQEIINSLNTVVSISKHVDSEYRIVGSLLIYIKYPPLNRRIGDIDVFFEKSKKKLLTDEFNKQGFELKVNCVLGRPISITAFKDGHIPINIVALGEFLKDYISIGTGLIELRVDSKYCKPVEYRLDGSRFIGVPLDLVIFGAKTTKLKPSQINDIEILRSRDGYNEVPKFNMYVLYFANIRIPYLYDLLWRIRDVIGWLKIKLGGRYGLYEAVGD